MDGTAVDPETTIPILNESAEAPPVRVTFCPQITSDEYQRQKVTATDEGVKELVKHLEKEPKAFKKLLKKRKHDELEKAGILSSLKVKFLSAIHGNKYKDVTDEEFMEKFAEVKSGMMMALNEIKENEGRRYSKRLLAKRRKKENEESGETSNKRDATPSLPVVAPEVPVGPVLTQPLGDKNSVTQRSGPGKQVGKIKRTNQDLEESFSEKTLASVHRELLRRNPQFRHRSGFQRGSAGRTPFSHKKNSRRQSMADTPTSAFNLTSMSIEESLNQDFDDIIQKKFMKSPSPVASPSSAAGFNMSTDDSTSVTEWEV